MKARCTEVTRKGAQCKRSGTWHVTKTGAKVCKVHPLELETYGLHVTEDKT